MDVLIGVAVGLAIFGSALWVIRILANPPPPEEAAVDLPEAIEYRCAVCATAVGAKDDSDPTEYQETLRGRRLR